MEFSTQSMLEFTIHLTIPSKTRPLITHSTVYNVNSTSIQRFLRLFIHCLRVVLDGLLSNVLYRTLSNRKFLLNVLSLSNSIKRFLYRTLFTLSTSSISLHLSTSIDSLSFLVFHQHVWTRISASKVSQSVPQWVPLRASDETRSTYGCRRSVESISLEILRTISIEGTEK